MSSRLTQEILESLLIGLPQSRLTQEIIEAVISNVVIPAKLRLTQNVVEVIIESSVVPPTATRYGPRIQSA